MPELRKKGTLLVSATRDSRGALEGGDAGSGATRGNHGATADCAHHPPGWYSHPNGSAGVAEEGALLVNATDDSLSASEAGEVLRYLPPQSDLSPSPDHDDLTTVK